LRSTCWLFANVGIYTFGPFDCMPA
jgi:hypothetical protein